MQLPAICSHYRSDVIFHEMFVQLTGLNSLRVIFFCLNISLFPMECPFPLLSYQKYLVGHVETPFCFQCRDSRMPGIAKVTAVTGGLDSAQPDCTLQSQPASAVHKCAALCTKRPRRTWCLSWQLKSLTPVTVFAVPNIAVFSETFQTNQRLESSLLILSTQECRRHTAARLLFTTV